MGDEITEWLRSLKLEQYASKFLDNGYDDPDSIPDLEETDLDAMDITLPGHRKRLLVNGMFIVGQTMVKGMNDSL